MAAPGASLSPAPAGRTEPRSRAGELRKRLAGSPWPGRLSRWLSLIAGALLITGALRPWVYVPVGGLRVPIFGLLSLGGLVLVGGLFLLLHPRPGAGPLLVVAVAAWYLASTVPPQLLASARGTTGIVEFLDRPAQPASLPVSHPGAPPGRLDAAGRARCRSRGDAHALGSRTVAPGGGRVSPRPPSGSSRSRELSFLPGTHGPSSIAEVLSGVRHRSGWRAGVRPVRLAWGAGRPVLRPVRGAAVWRATAPIIALTLPPGRGNICPG